MNILVIRGNIQTAKSYPDPYWDELIKLLKDHEIKEIKGILPEQEIIDLVNWCDTWISIDSFLQHLCAYKNLKPGIVLWGLSDPELFGYKHNINLLKDRKYLRPDQYRWWNDVPYNADAFISPDEVIKALGNVIIK
jgi:ADP-heptose:LPS heptosyltransferase